MSISHLFQLQTGLSHQFEGIHAFKHSDLVLKWCEKALAPLGCFRKVFRWFINSRMGNEILVCILYNWVENDYHVKHFKSETLITLGNKLVGNANENATWRKKKDKVEFGNLVIRILLRRSHFYEEQNTTHCGNKHFKQTRSWKLVTWRFAYFNVHLQMQECSS